MKICILGLGRVFQHYEKNFIDDLFVNNNKIYLFDSDFKKLNFVNKKHNYIRLSSMDQLIEEKIDIGIVSTPSGTHYEITKFLLNNGINVLTEKPPTMNEKELKELIILARNKCLKYGVIFQNRLNRSMQIAKKIIDKQLLGQIKVCSIKLHWCREQEYYNDEWHGTWKQDGGVINQQAIHHVDAMQWLNGPLDCVSSCSENLINNLEAEDTMIALVKFKNGSLGTIEASTAIRPKDKEASIFLSGTKGFLKVGGVALNLIEEYSFNCDDKLLLERLNNASLNVESGYGTSHKEVVEDFINAVSNDEDPCITASSTINTVRAINALYMSSESMKWANVDKYSISNYLGK